MNENNSKKPFKIKTYHSESASKKGESVAAYKARVKAEKDAKNAALQAKNEAQIKAEKAGKIDAKLLIKIELILGGIFTILALIFMVINIHNFAWISSPYFLIFSALSIIFSAISNRTMTFIEHKSSKM